MRGQKKTWRVTRDKLAQILFMAEMNADVVTLAQTVELSAAYIGNILFTKAMLETGKEAEAWDAFLTKTNRWLFNAIKQWVELTNERTEKFIALGENDKFERMRKNEKH